jgi:hypothetical protein
VQALPDLGEREVRGHKRDQAQFRGRQRRRTKSVDPEGVERRSELLSLSREFPRSGTEPQDVPGLPQDDPGAVRVGERQVRARELRSVWTASNGTA